MQLLVAWIRSVETKKLRMRSTDKIVQDLFDTVPPTLNPNVTGWLVYNNSAVLPAPQNISEFDPFDDSTLVAYDQEPLFEDPTYTAVMNFQMGDLGDGAN